MVSSAWEVVSVEAMIISTLVSRHLINARIRAELASAGSEPVVEGAVLTGGLEMLVILEAFRAYLVPYSVVASKQVSRSLPAQGSGSQSVLVCTRQDKLYLPAYLGSMAA